MDYGFEGEFKGLLNGKLADREAFRSVVTNGLTAGAEFAMFGDTSINVLNTSMFGLPGSQGLLSLNLSNDGIRGSIGGGGLDMNLGNMWKAARVGSIFDQNNAMEDSGFDSDELVAGRVLWSDGIDQTSKLLDELLSGDAVLNRGNLTEGVAKTTLVDGVKQIDLSKITEEDIGLMLGVILSHEAMRDGIEGSEQEQAMETFRSVLTHSIVGQMVGNTYGMASLDAGVIADIKALQSGDMDAFARYALGKFDGSADFWKLKVNADGTHEMVDDGRSSLYIETENGGEFNLWNMEGLSKEESYQKIVNSGGSLSEESMKRLGLFSITKAESNIGEEAFGRLAYNSYKVNDELGYFVDFSVVEDEMQRRHKEGKFVEDADGGIMKPGWNYTFNPNSVGSLAATYGTLLGTGMTFSYNNGFTGEDSREQLSTQSESVDELAYGMNNVFNTHNQKLASTGAPYFGRNLYTRDIEIKQSSDLVGTAAGGAAMIAQYTEGMLQGFEVTKIQLPMWQIGGNNYFTAIRPELSTFTNNNGNLNAESIPKFYSSTDLMFDNSIKNYANYLEMDEGFKKNWLGGFNNYLRGWDY
ncbi:MAG: hypothetical protein L3J12_02390 [Spirochaetales bacterium]|nr:hypothetical protein [Spirochaetales bacterium]